MFQQCPDKFFLKYEKTLLILCLDSLARIAQNANQKYLSISEATYLYSSELKQQTYIAFPGVKEKPIKWLASLSVTWLANDYSTKSSVYLFVCLLSLSAMKI